MDAAAGEPEVLFTPGDIVSVGEPWVFTPGTQHLGNTCHFCLSKPSIAPRNCSGCYYAKYCDQDCQRCDWKLRHKYECAVVQKLMQNQPVGDTETLLLAMQVINKLKNGTIEDIETYNQYTSKTQAASQDQIAQERFRDWSSGLRMLHPNGRFHNDPRAFYELYSKVVYNCAIIEGLDKEGGTPGQGLALYKPNPFRSVVLGCNRNLLSYSRGRKLFVRATKTIREGDQLVMCAGQGSPFLCPNERIARYREVFSDCGCEACNLPSKEAERNVFLCGTPRCNTPIALDDRANDPCGACGRVNSDRLESARDYVTTILENVETNNSVQDAGPIHTMSSRGLNDSRIEVLLRRAEKILHPTNFSLGLLYKLAAEAAMVVGEHARAIRFMERMLLPMECHTDPYLEEITCALRLIGLFYDGQGNQQLYTEHWTRYQEKMATVHTCDTPEMRVLELMPTGELVGGAQNLGHLTFGANPLMNLF